MKNKDRVWRTVILAVLLPGLGACGGGGNGGTEPPPEEPPPAEQFSIGGVITAAPGSAADGDTNDPQSPLRPNNQPAEAQPLPNPVRVGGYVTAGPTGRPIDRFASVADPRDFYRIELAAGQRIELTISDWEPGGADLDLWLYETGNPVAPVVVDASLGTGPVESLVAPVSGAYWVEVRAFSGRSNYLLTIGDVTGMAASDLQLGAALVPGEVVVRTRPPTAVQQAGGAPEPPTVLASAGLTLAAGEPERLARLVATHPGHSLQTLGMVDAAADPAVSLTVEQRQRLDTLLLVKALRGMPEIELAAPNYLRDLQRVPNDPGFAQQWHYSLIQLPQAWDLTTGGNGEVIVAIPDTGVFLEHEDLQGQVVPGYDFIDGVPGGDDPGDGAVVGESTWHGTHVAGTVAARTNNAMGGAGVSWGARIMPLRVIGPRGGTDYDLVQGMRFALRLPNDSSTVPARRADVINLSLGTTTPSPLYPEMVQAARDAGVIITAAAGNQASSQPLFPAALDGVLSVTAVGPGKEPASYANFGPTIDLTAPGGEQRQGTTAGVLSTLVEVVGGNRRSGYGFLQGTSMAAPHVAGVVALMKSIYPELDYDTFRSLLISGRLTEDLGPPGFDERHGWGLIDGLKAVFEAQSLAATGVAPGILVATPSTLDFGALLTERNLRIGRLGDQSLAVGGITSNVDWLTIQALSVDAAGLGDYRIGVDRIGLTPANYTAGITVTSSLNTILTIPVNLRVGAGGSGDVGLVYVLLLDNEFRVVDERAVLAGEGRYSFNFDGVESGDYFLVAGTDADNDGFICDAGEACGAYPTIGVPDPVRIDRDRSALDFVIGYSSSELQIERIPVDSEESAGFRRLPSGGQRNPHGVR